MTSVRAGESPAFFKLAQMSHQGHLSKGLVNDVYEDSRGFLWFATTEGLYFYDGYGEHLIQEASVNETRTISAMNMVSITGAKNEGLWAATRQNIYQVSIDTMQIHPYWNHQTRTEIGSILQIIKDKKSASLFVVSSQGLFRMSLNNTHDIKKLSNFGHVNLALQNNHEKGFFLLNRRTLFQLQGDDVTTLPLRTPNRIKYWDLVFVNSDNRLFLAGAGGLYERNEDGSLNRLWQGKGWTDVIFNGIAEDGMGRLWMSAEGKGVIAVDIKTKETISLNSSNSDLYDNRIQGLKMISNEVLWIFSIHQGPLFHDVFQQHFNHNPLSLEQSDEGFGSGLVNNAKHFIITEHDWFIGNESGLFRYSHLDKTFSMMSVEWDDKYYGEAIIGLEKKEDSFLWVATRKGVYLLDVIKNQLTEIYTDDSIWSLHQASKKLYIGTRRKGLIVFDMDSREMTEVSKQSSENHYRIITSIYSDKKDMIWLSGIQGLQHFNPELNQFTNIDLKYKQQDFNNTLIKDIVEDDKGYFWLASGQGLIKAKREKEQLVIEKVYDKKMGLEVENIESVEVDNNGDIWVSSDEGIMTISENTQEIEKYDALIDLGQVGFNASAKFKKDHVIYFGGLDGITYFSPSKKEKEYQDKQFWISLVKYGKQLKNHIGFPRKKMFLQKQDNTLSVYFSTNQWNKKKNITFRYRFNERDDWIYQNNINKIVLANLDTGTHYLMVESKVLGGDWMPVVNPLSFEIMELPWLTRQALLLYGVLICLFLFAIFYQEVRRRKHKQLALEKIKESENRMEKALWASGQGFWDWHTNENIMLRKNLDLLLGLKQEENNEEDFLNRIHTDDMKKLIQQRKELTQGADYFEVQYRAKNKTGEWRWISDRGRVINRDKNNKVIRVCGTYSDITGLKEVETSLKVFGEIVHSMTEVVIVLDKNQKVTFVNPAFSIVMGYDEQEILNKSIIRLRSSRHKDEYYESVWKQFEEFGKWMGELWCYCKNGKDILCAIEGFQIYNYVKEEKQYVLMLSNITEKRKAEKELNYLARYDMLTGLPNRSLFMDRLGHALALAKRNHYKIAVMFMDLDGFKKVNDSFGHHVGDLLLQKTSELISNFVREGDTLARLSGDEFTLLVEDYKNKESLEFIAKKILDEFKKPIKIARHEVVVSSSIGISQYPDDAESEAELMKYADTAMYHSKENGKGQYSFYQEKMHVLVMKKMRIESQLRTALKNNEFYLDYQPVFDLEVQDVVALEALLRWKNTELGEVSPSEFIALAEELGLIVEIGKVMLEKVFKKILYFNTHLQKNMTIAVNVSVKQLMENGFLKFIKYCVEKYPIQPNQLKIEITESMLMANANQAVSILESLSDMGIRLSVDDFGTGYSSLSYLKRFSVNELKIDKEFIADITKASKEEMIVNAILALAKSLDLDVVAEGVETKKQCQYLKERGCRYVQGFLLAKPLSDELIDDFLNDYKKYDFF